MLSGRVPKPLTRQDELVADTVVLTREESATSGLHPSLEPDIPPEILEKPGNKADNLRMLLDMNGKSCEVVTGVTVGKSRFSLKERPKPRPDNLCFSAPNM